MPLSSREIKGDFTVNTYSGGPGGGSIGHFDGWIVIAMGHSDSRFGQKKLGDFLILNDERTYMGVCRGANRLAQALNTVISPDTDKIGVRIEDSNLMIGIATK